MPVEWEAEKADLTEYQVLIIDDEQHLMSSLRRCMKKEGYDVTVADNGEHAIKCAREKSPDIVLLDAAMPDMNGYEIMERIRAECDVPIVMFSGEAQLDYVLSRDNPPDAFVQKPVDRKLLLSTVRYLLIPSYGL